MALRLLTLCIILLALMVALSPMAATSASGAPAFRVLHAFGSSGDGVALWGSLLLDSQGNLYGTTNVGGPKLGGTVFQLAPQADGTWKETIITAFNGNKGPSFPFDGPILDPEGNLYGTTSTGLPCIYGTVFELKPNGSGWTPSLIHCFGPKEPADGPYGGVVMDPMGNLYGYSGSAFELSPGPTGWQEKILHAFTCANGDGCGIGPHPILDAAGNLYGTTNLGGAGKNGCGCGIAYELQPQPDGTWKEIILHSFGSFPNDGVYPQVGALAMDSAGNLYGTTAGFNAGTIYELTPQPNGHWKETILYKFHAGSGGNGPGAGVVLDPAGNLYGATVYGGDAGCYCGVVYKLAPNGNGTWTYTVLHKFIGSDGAGPDANLIIDTNGNLYGTTPTGGTYGAGVVFEVTP